MNTPPGKTYDTMPAAGDAAVGDEPEAAPETPAEPAAEGAGNITLDMTNPDISEQFADCEPGETLKVVSKDENTLVLSKEGGYETPGESATPDAGEAGEDMTGDSAEEPKGAVAILMAKKKKR